MMRKLGALSIALLLATAAAAGAGNDVKWKRSKKLKTVPSSRALDEFGSDVERMESKYMLDWTPYRNPDIDFILATYYGWEVYAVTMNNEVRKRALTKEELPARAEAARREFEDYVLFLIKIRIKNGEFYETTGEEYWTFYSPTSNGDLEPARVDCNSYKKSITTAIGFGSPGILPPGPDYRWYREYKIYFDKAALGKEPQTRKLVLKGGDIKRGFEWRFKEE
jgi:hypothetical protein